MFIKTSQQPTANSQQHPVPEIHKARWIITDSRNIIEDGFVKTESGIITEVGQGKSHGDGHVIDHGSGALFPVFVNAHTHLELCALKGKIPFEHGFQQWVRQLLQQRDAADIEVLKTGAESGIRELADTGCGVIGEISTLGITWKILSQSDLAGIWFREFLGNTVDVLQLTLNQQPTANSQQPPAHFTSLAGHAPHTTAPRVLTALKHATRKHRLPFSIHLAESEDEIEFLTTGKGLWADFLTERGICFSDWGLPVKSPVQYLENMGLLDEKTLAVHLIHADRKDFEILLRHKVKVCLCLRSNANLHKKLPDVETLIQSGIYPCLGTDSLASTDSLSMFDEMAFLSHTFPNIPPADILTMATLNGANALGMDDKFGSLIPGKCGIFVYVPVNVSNRTTLLEMIVSGVKC